MSKIGLIIEGLQDSKDRDLEMLFEFAADGKPKKTWTKDEIKDLLLNNDRAVVRALQVIYSLQTDLEKTNKITVVDNKVGFNGVDAKFLSSVAEYFKQHNRLTPKQLESVRKTMLKYAGQLTKVANGEIKVIV